MSNLLLGVPNRVDGATLTGGAWRAGLPLANLADGQFAKVARSTDAALASTLFDSDLGAARALRIVALSNHNLGRYATWRVTLGSAPGGADLHDSGWMPVWRMTLDNELLRWESPAWWVGTASDEFIGAPFPAVYALPDWHSARYVRVELNDTTNAAGYVQIGRAHICNAIQPLVNATYGLADGWTDLSTSTRAESGARWFAARRRIRTVRFNLERTTLGEGDVLYELLRSAGTVGEVFYVPDPAEMAASQRYGFAARLSQLSALSYPRPASRAIPFSLEEII